MDEPKACGGCPLLAKGFYCQLWRMPRNPADLSCSQGAVKQWIGQAVVVLTYLRAEGEQCKPASAESAQDTEAIYAATDIPTAFLKKS